MKKAITGLFLTIIALIVTSVSLSLAWYSNSNILKIESFELELAGNEELYIGTNPDEEFTRQHLSASDLKEVGKFKPVSAMFSSKWMKDKATNPTFFDSYQSNESNFDDPDNPHYAIPVETAAEDGFFSQEIYLYSKSSYCAVIDTQETYIRANHEMNLARARELIREGDQRSEEEITNELDQIADSTRISILTTHEDRYAYSILDPNKKENEIVRYGGLLDNDLSGQYEFLTAKNLDRYEILFGEVNDRSLIRYGEKTSEEIPPEGKVNWYNSGHAKNCYPVDFYKSTGLEIKQEPSLSLTENDVYLDKLSSLSPEEKDKLLIVPIDARKPTRIVVSIYCEGWDKDNINDTMAASFDVKLSFKTMSRHII